MSIYFRLQGKEKIWISIADTFDLKVWLEPNRRKAAECILKADDPIRRRIVDRQEDATVHIVALGETSYPVNCVFLFLDITFQSNVNAFAAINRLPKRKFNLWSIAGNSTERLGETVQG